MGRSQRHYPKRLTDEERVQLEQERTLLRARVALLEQRGKRETVHHTMLARVEAALRDDAPPALNQEESEHGTP